MMQPGQRITECGFGDGNRPERIFFAERYIQWSNQLTGFRIVFRRHLKRMLQRQRLGYALSHTANIPHRRAEVDRLAQLIVRRPAEGPKLFAKTFGWHRVRTIHDVSSIGKDRRQIAERGDFIQPMTLRALQRTARQLFGD